MSTVKPKTIDDMSINEKDSASLLECYRIALDFGMPAAIKAYEKLTQDSIIKQPDLTAEPGSMYQS